MIRVFFVALLLAAVAQQPDPSRHDKYKADAHAYCLAAKPEDSHGHECHCKLQCDPDDNGMLLEDAACEMYCSKHRCVCHSDEPCEPGTL